MHVLTVDIRMINSSGIGTYIKNIMPILINAMPNYKFNLIGHEQELSELNELSWIKNNNVRIIPSKANIYSIGEQFELPKLIPSDTELFWSPHYNVPLLYRGKLMVTIHDVFHLAMPRFVKGIEKKIYAKIMYNAVRIKANAIISVSKFTKDELRKYVGINNKKVYVVPNGVSNDWFNVRGKCSPHNRPYLIYVGNVKPHKNLKQLLKAYEKTNHRIQYDLIIVGKKEGFITGDTEIENLSKDMEGRVKFTGYIDDGKLQQYVSNASAMIFPSLYEGFGLPPLEALACGCPTIVSSEASLPEVCGESGIYFNPYQVDDISEKLLNFENIKEDEKRKIINNGVKRAREFNWEESATKTKKIIKELL